jgi:small subunit ribosomal protein S24e
MEIEITSKVNNVMLDRTEIKFTVTHTGEPTPNRDVIRNELAEKLNVKKEDVIVKTVKPSFGNNKMKGYAKVYSSPDKAKALEPDYVLIRNKLMEKKVKEGKKPAAEKPAVINRPPKEAAKEAPAKPVVKEEKPAKEAPKQPEAKKE